MIIIINIFLHHFGRYYTIRYDRRV